MKKSLILAPVVGLALAIAACGDSDSEVAEEAAGYSGQTINTVSNVLGSIESVAAATLRLGGTATTYCNAQGGPADGGVDLDNTDTGYMGAVGYCQATHNSVSPDTVRGAIGIAGGMLCEAAQKGMFTGLVDGGTTSKTESITFNTTCWGSAQDVEDLSRDMDPTGTGPFTIPAVAITLSEVSATTAYKYHVTYGVGGEGGDPIELHIIDEDGISAALSSEGWAFKFVRSTGTLLYESIDSNNSRRNRIMISGTLDGDAYTAISNISGFQTQNNGLYTYTGTLAGLIGNSYTGDGVADANDKVDECFAPGSAGDCTGLTSITGDDDGDLASNIAADDAALTAYTSALIDFSTIDTADPDITD